MASVRGTPVGPGPSLWPALWPTLWAGLLAWVLGGSVWATSPDTDALRLAVERDYPPFVFVNTQQPGPQQAQGWSIDMLRLVQQATGLRVVEQPAAPLSALLDDLRAGQADLITSLRPTPERAAFLEFTRPYIWVPAILVVPSHHAPLAAADALLALQGRAVAVGKGYAAEAAMRKAHPQVRWQAVSDDTQALQGVVSGLYDAAVTDAASAAHIMQTLGLSGLRSAGRVGFDYGLSFGLRRGQPGLRERLDAAIVAISPQQRQAVLDRWLHPLKIQTLDAAPAWPALLGAGLLGAGVLLSWLVWRSPHKTPHQPPPGPPHA